MSVSDQLLGGLSLYGMPLLFGVTVVSCAGLPLPTSLLLVAAGSFADHGEMNPALIILIATLGSVLGDQFGYALGRWGDRAFAARLAGWLGGEQRLAQAEAHARRWGGLGIFFTRWFLTPLGPFINLASGFARYPWHRFLLWDVLGEMLWVGLYVGLGIVFSHRVQELSSLLGEITWAVLAMILAIFLGWKLLRSLKPGIPASQ